ncbi:MAG TPA: hypothetical protein VLU25_14760 [Acidobacteriota bacterium]|nr:hypothetical protein [Acidobacteriota bacterium]
MMTWIPTRPARLRIAVTLLAASLCTPLFMGTEAMAQADEVVVTLVRWPYT